MRAGMRRRNTLEYVVMLGLVTRSVRNRGSACGARTVIEAPFSSGSMWGCDAGYRLSYTGNGKTLKFEEVTEPE